MVLCTEACTNNIVRLRGSLPEYSGCVNICVKTICASVCDENWDIKDA